MKSISTKWTDSEIKLLKSCHKRYLIDDVINMINRSKSSIKNKCFRLGISLEIDAKESVICNNCLNSFIAYIKEHRKFCSHVCAASKTSSGRKLSETTKNKISDGLIKYYNTNKRIRKKQAKYKKIRENYKKKCSSCNREFDEKNIRICEFCKIEYYKYYRVACNFTFNLSDYSDKFDFSLIEKFGWYKAKNRGNNLIGISRDHMYSVKDGFKNKISPLIISHPANCKLMKHDENNKKKTNSSITLDELLIRIANW